MIAAAIVVFASLFVLATRQLRVGAIGLLAALGAGDVLTVGQAPRAEIALSGVAALAAAGTLYLAAHDFSYGEDPGWRVWPAIAIAAIATTLAYRVFASLEVDPYLQLCAFWLLAVGLGVLITARAPARAIVGALLMLGGTVAVTRFQPGSHLATSIAFAWLEVHLALVGAFLIGRQRRLEEAA